MLKEATCFLTTSPARPRFVHSPATSNKLGPSVIGGGAHRLSGIKISRLGPVTAQIYTGHSQGYATYFYKANGYQ
jgi:hypothetical protein